MLISLIAALDQNNIIGAEGTVPWHLPNDMRFFKQTTMGKPVVMGRKTYDSIGKPLPGRQNIIITRNQEYEAPGCEVVHSVEQALEAAGEAEEVMILGGAEIYEQVLPQTDRLYLTFVDGSFEGDTTFPTVDWEAWRLVWEETHQPDERHNYPYRFTLWERI